MSVNRIAGGVVGGLAAVPTIGWLTTKIVVATNENSYAGGLGILLGIFAIGALLGAARSLLPASFTVGLLVGMAVAVLIGLLTSPAVFPLGARGLQGFYYVGAWSTATWAVMGLLAASLASRTTQTPARSADISTTV